MREVDVAVVGGGLIGLAIAYGLTDHGLTVAVLDEGDIAYRASRGNFGLVWVQGKGVGQPAYARWSRRAASLWPEFAERLESETGIALELKQPGGLEIALEERELETLVADLASLRTALDDDYPFEALDHAGLAGLVPEIGPEVVGATYFPEDGHVNPLHLMRALHQAFVARGGRYVPDARVLDLRYRAGGFELVTGEGTTAASRVVLAAGLANVTLSAKVGLSAPVHPNRGQILVTERLRPFLGYPSIPIRQTGNGAMLLGSSEEDVGYDDRTTPAVVAAIARRAVRILPLLEGVRVVRAWGALRVLSPDGLPIYDCSENCPGAFVLSSHSGVTLAPVHAGPLARWIAGAEQLPEIAVFGSGRFDVQAVG